MFILVHVTIVIQTGLPSSFEFCQRGWSEQVQMCRGGKTSTTPAEENGYVKKMWKKIPSQTMFTSRNTRSPLWLKLSHFTVERKKGARSPPAARGPPKAAPAGNFLNFFQISTFLLSICWQYIYITGLHPRRTFLLVIFIAGNFKNIGVFNVILFFVFGLGRVFWLVYWAFVSVHR